MSASWCLTGFIQVCKTVVVVTDSASIDRFLYHKVLEWGRLLECGLTVSSVAVYPFHLSIYWMSEILPTWQTMRVMVYSRSKFVIFVRPFTLAPITLGSTWFVVWEVLIIISCLAPPVSQGSSVMQFLQAASCMVELKHNIWVRHVCVCFWMPCERCTVRVYCPRHLMLGDDHRLATVQRMRRRLEYRSERFLYVSVSSPSYSTAVMEEVDADALNRCEAA